MIEETFGLYVILTDPVAGYEKAAAAAVERGVRVLQLRMKKTPPAVVLETARKIARITWDTGTLFIVNDEPGIARGCAADGVHVGQGDISVGDARKAVPGRIVGYSTHNTNQVDRANLLAPDYIGVGPVYKTPTKDNPDPVIGLDGMRTMIGRARMPHVAIGGIDASNLPEVLAAGARNFAVVRAVCGSDRPSDAIGELQRIWSDTTGLDLPL